MARLITFLFLLHPFGCNLGPNGLSFTPRILDLVPTAHFLDRHYVFLLGRKDGYFLYTARLIPAGLGALCASLIADLARAIELIGKEPLGEPPEGPAKDLTFG